MVLVDLGLWVDVCDGARSWRALGSRAAWMDLRYGWQGRTRRFDPFICQPGFGLVRPCRRLDPRPCVVHLHRACSGWICVPSPICASRFNFGVPDVFDGAVECVHGSSHHLAKSLRRRPSGIITPAQTLAAHNCGSQYLNLCALGYLANVAGLCAYLMIYRCCP